MSLFTIEEVHDAAMQATGATGDSDFNRKADELLLDEFIKQATVRNFDIFLSHASSGKKVVTGMYTLLRNMGFSVYVDWIHDRQLDRTKINPATADTIQQRMNQCDTFLFLTTRRCAVSEWMPWECGYFEGRGGHVAVLPVVDKPADHYEGQNYLGLYPFVARSNLGSGKNVLRIHNPRDPARSSFYQNWIEGQTP